MNHRLHRLAAAGLVLLLAVAPVSAQPPSRDYLSARWDPLHFKPAIDSARDEQCLECHRNILERRPLLVSPAGKPVGDRLAWYQTLDVYQGEQETFHRRHLVTPEAQRLMRFKCNSCHQGHDPKDEASGSTDDTQAGLTLRKTVDPDICLMCHGKFDFQVMAGLPGDWTEVRDQFRNDCVTCHQEYRTARHKLNFLNEEEIEKAGAESSDSCYGCHGGRAWYAVAYPYVRRPWLERMPGVAPEWAKDRPDAYDPRFTR
ncbi:MAG: hypothetical protein U9Q81_05425 [Pseudomonadota bacterium]|nr:hypothetical protein [Pseudomonadota bacterium]